MRPSIPERFHLAANAARLQFVYALDPPTGPVHRSKSLPARHLGRSWWMWIPRRAVSGRSAQGDGQLARQDHLRPVRVPPGATRKDTLRSRPPRTRRLWLDATQPTGWIRGWRMTSAGRPRTNREQQPGRGQKFAAATHTSAGRSRPAPPA